MNIQAEINWIQNEIATVKDPELISAFKNMLKYRKKQVEKTLNKDLLKKLTNRAKKSEQDIQENRLLTKEEMKNKTNKFLNK